jgi:TPR repeat protein
MARFEIAEIECACFAEVPAGADAFFALGMMHSLGGSVPIDYVSAHKWFNLAAMRGNADAVRLRREIADEMSGEEIVQAQRAARAWLEGSRSSPAPDRAVNAAAMTVRVPTFWRLYPQAVQVSPA